jgi:hypothetical protein
MSGVVLRCSNCGTVQASTGECEACHEAQVRYFCTNHTPGLWLDVSACPQCGARFGEYSPTATPKRTTATKPVPDRPRSSPETARPAPDPEDELGPWDTMPSPSLDGDPRERFRRPTLGTLLEAIVYADRARRRREVRSIDASDTPVHAPGSGCVRRLLLLALLLGAFFLLVPLLLGGALLQML